MNKSYIAYTLAEEYAELGTIYNELYDELLKEREGKNRTDEKQSIRTRRKMLNASMDTLVDVLVMLDISETMWNKALNKVHLSNSKKAV